MALRATAEAASALPRGLRRLFSTSFFVPPQTKTELPPKADPNNNLFVSGLSKRTTTEGLREAFEKFGEVVHARVITDRVSGFSKGFGFVRYATLEDAAEGIKGMDGKYLDGWVIFAEYARPRPPLPPRENYGPTPYSGPTQYGDASYPGYNSGNPEYIAPQNTDPSHFAYNSQPFDNANSYSGPSHIGGGTQYSSAYNGSGSQQYSNPSPTGSPQYNGPFPNGSSEYGNPSPQYGLQPPTGSSQYDNPQNNLPLAGGPFSSQDTGAPYTTGSPPNSNPPNMGAPLYSGYSQAGNHNQYGSSEGVSNGSQHYGAGQGVPQYDSATSEPIQHANSG